MMKNSLKLAGIALLMAVTVACKKNEIGMVDLTEDEDTVQTVTAKYTFSHPCAMYTQTDFDRVKTTLDNGTAPQAVKDEFQNLKNSSYTMLTYQSNPQALIVRGDVTGTGLTSENYAYAMRDAAAAYQMALLWKLTGNNQYAEASIVILKAWANTCKEIKSNDANQMLAAGCQGYTFANAAEIMQTYSGWASTDKAIFKEWIVTVFASKNRQFLDYHWKQGITTCIKHYWSNWDLVNMCSYLAIGILTENNDMVNYVVNYFHSGGGNGAIKNLAIGSFTDPLGTGETISQNQESGRDQGHAQMSVAVAAHLAQMAYSLYQTNRTVSELDFFSAQNNALMRMGEYVALFNLRSGTDNANANGTWLIQAAKMPFQTYDYCVGCTCPTGHSATQTAVADDAGRGGPRPGWEILFNHYARTKALSSGYTYIQQYATKLRPEGGAGDSRYGVNSGAFDQLGWNTLMLYRQ